MAPIYALCPYCDNLNHLPHQPRTNAVLCSACGSRFALAPDTLPSPPQAGRQSIPGAAASRSPQPSPDARFNFQQLAFRILAGLFAVVGLVFIYFILFQFPSARDEKIADAERQMNRAWRDMSYSRDAAGRFVDAARSRRVAEDAPEWAVAVPKLIQIAAVLFLFGGATYICLRRSGDITP